MFRFTPKRRENTAKVLVSLIAVDFATLVTGNLLRPMEFHLPIFFLGCTLGAVFYMFLLLVEG